MINSMFYSCTSYFILTIFCCSIFTLYSNSLSMNSTSLSKSLWLSFNWSISSLFLVYNPMLFTNTFKCLLISLYILRIWFFINSLFLNHLNTLLLLSTPNSNSHESNTGCSWTHYRTWWNSTTLFEFSHSHSESSESFSYIHIHSTLLNYSSESVLASEWINQWSLLSHSDTWISRTEYFIHSLLLFFGDWWDWAHPSEHF